MNKVMDSNFNRVLSKWDTFTLSFGAMIGWGWMVLTDDWIIKAGAQVYFANY